MNKVLKKLSLNFIEQKELLDEMKEYDNKKDFNYLREEYKVPKSLIKLLEYEDDILLSQMKVIQDVYSYIKENDLIDKKNKCINVDKKLKRGLRLDDDEELTFYNIQKKIYDLY